MKKSQILVHILVGKLYKKTVINHLLNHVVLGISHSINF